ncbi:MAG: MFS transporter [Actinomycetia bacterium]|nr:MFS transporter [Actinomycetes bacterium]
MSDTGPVPSSRRLASDTTPQPPPWVVMAVVAFGVFVAADDLMVVATMLRPMIADFDLVVPDDLDDAAWIVNVYLIAYIAVMPLAGRLSDVLGRRAVFIGALAIFGFGSIVVPAASSLAMLLVGRVLTAVGGGALVPVALAVAGDLYTGRRRARALGLLGAIETIGWVWGPLYGAVLVRFLTWQWQFHLNIPLALAGMVVGWRVLDPTSRASRQVDWLGAGLLTVGLVALNVGLLNEARIQTVTGLDQLRDQGGGLGSVGGLWLYGVAAVALAGFVWHERRASEPLVSPELVMQRSVGAALGVNALIGVGLVIALINVPLFVNIVEGGLQESAVRAGWLLTALTATMAVTSYVGGLASGRFGYRGPTLVGLGLGAAGLLMVGATWAPDTGGVTMAVQLGLVGAGIGLILAPASAVVVDASADSQRGTAAGLVIMARLIGFSIGLAALTAWGLHRYDVLRHQVELPSITDPGFADAVTEATIGLSTSALTETFTGAAIALIVALPLALLLRSSDPSEVVER